MKKHTLFFALYLFSIFTFGQSKFQPIQVTKQDGTVLEGLGFYQVKNAQAAVKLEFRKNENLPVEYFSAADIKLGQFDNGRVIIPLKLPDTLMQEPVLAEQLVTGRAYLYRYGDRFFISRFDRPLFELKQSYIQDPKNHVITLVKKQYQGVLKVYLIKDCPTLESSIDKTQFTEESLTKTLIEYHECMNDSIQVNKKSMPWTIIEPSLALRTGVGKMSLFGQRELYGIAGKLVTPLQLSGHLAINFSFPRSNSKYSLQTEIWYTSQNFDRYGIVKGEYSTVNVYHSFRLNELRVPIGVKYTMNNSPFSPYLNAGAVLRHILKVKTYYRYEQIGADFTRVTETDHPLVKGGIMPALWFGMGAKHHKLPFSAEMRYTWDPQLFQYLAATYANGHSYNLVLAYHL